MDIIEINRIENAIKRNNMFLCKVFNQEEIMYYAKRKYRAEFVAGGFAAKEAISKALGTGFRGFSLKDIQITRNEMGKPEVELRGRANEIAKEKGEYIMHLSISHSDNNAVAYAILEVLS